MKKVKILRDWHGRFQPGTSRIPDSGMRKGSKPRVYAARKKNIKTEKQIRVRFPFACMDMRKFPDGKVYLELIFNAEHPHIIEQ